MMVWTRVVCAPALMAIHSEKRTPQPRAVTVISRSLVGAVVAVIVVPPIRRTRNSGRNRAERLRALDSASMACPQSCICN